MNTLIYTKKILIFGCGNTLFGNDGFGPEVIKRLNAEYSISEDVLALDAGTGVRDFIFDLLLAEKKPAVLWIIDAITVEKKNEGDVFEINLSDFPKKKKSDFSLHQSPSSNLLDQLMESGVQVKILGMHTPSIPNEISPGLSPAAQKAIKKACDWIVHEINNIKQTTMGQSHDFHTGLPKKPEVLTKHQILD
ncbi:MAG: hydrogenase maturation protease [Desulfobacula sp.]|nr:hydrogenase maturation protease [Desulfobacula sp.]